MYSEKLEALIKSVLADGVITEKERAVLHKNAAAEGIDEDEIDVYVDGLIAQMRTEAPKSSKINSKYVIKSFDDEVCYYVGKNPYLVNKIPDCPYEKIYLNFFKKESELGISIARICNPGMMTYDFGPNLQLTTDISNIELARSHSGNWSRFGSSFLKRINYKKKLFGGIST